MGYRFLVNRWIIAKETRQESAHYHDLLRSSGYEPTSDGRDTMSGYTQGQHNSHGYTQGLQFVARVPHPDILGGS